MFYLIHLINGNRPVIRSRLHKVSVGKNNGAKIAWQTSALNDTQGRRPGIHLLGYPSLSLVPPRDLVEEHRIFLAAAVRFHCQKQKYRISFEQRCWPEMYCWMLMRGVVGQGEVMLGY